MKKEIRSEILRVRFVALVLIGMACNGQAQEFPPYWTIALTGDPMPGLPNDVVLDAVSIYPNFSPVLGEAGHVVLAGRLRNNGTTVVSANDVAVWRGLPGNLQLMAREGDPAPGHPESGLYSAFSTASVNTNGDVAFTGQVSGAGVTLANSFGTWANDANGNAAFLASGRLVRLLDSGKTLINNDGQATSGRGILLRSPTTGTAPGSPGPLTLRWDFGAAQPGITEGASLAEAYSVFANGQGNLFISGRLKTDQPGVVANYNDRAFWSEQGGTAHLVARWRASAPGTSTVFAENPSGGWNIKVNENLQSTLYTKLAGVSTGSDLGVWSTRTGSLQLLAREGSQAPGLANGTIFGENTYGDLQLGQNALGEVHFETFLSGGDVVSGQNDYALWSNSGGSLHCIARGGDPVPGLPAPNVYWSIGNKALGDNGRIAFGAFYVPSPGATTPVLGVLIAEDSNGTKCLVTRENALHPTFGNAGGTVSTAFPKAWLPDGRLLYSVFFTNGANGLYATEVGSAGPPTAILCNGASFALQDGRVKPVQLWSLRSVNQRGDLLMEVSFTDGTRGMFVAGTKVDGDGDGLPDAWELRYFGSTAATDDPNGDFDGDGLTNLMEYALNHNPTVPDSAGVPTFVADTAPGTFKFSFFRARAELTYRVRTSANLVNWSTLATNPGNVGEMVTVPYTIAPQATAGFLRLEVSNP